MDVRQQEEAHGCEATVVRVGDLGSLQLAQLFFSDGVLSFSGAHSHGAIFGVLACSTQSFLDEIMDRDVCVAA